MSGEESERLKAAVQYKVGKICEEIGAQQGKTFDKRVMASIADAAYQLGIIFGRDLELFAKHAKRTTVNQDDVLLLVRRNQKLVEYVQKLCAELNTVTHKTEAKAGAVMTDEQVDDDFK